MEVLVLSPVWRSREEANHIAMMNLFTHSEFTMSPPLFNDADIARARSRGATYFLDRTNADVAFWCDSDLDFRDKDVLQLCEQAMDERTSVMAGIYPTRRASEAVPASRLLLDYAYTFGDDPTPQPILWAAGGFTAVHRRVYARLAKEDPEMKVLHEGDEVFRMRPFYKAVELMNDDGSPVWGAEDWSFSERARRIGYPSYANCAVDLAHIGTYRYTIRNLFTAPKMARPIRFTRRSDGNLVERKADTLADPEMR
jgi:hypothetical protein